MAELKYDENGRLLFTKEMKDEGYKILAPSMAPIHFSIIKNVFIHAAITSSLSILQAPRLRRQA